MEGTFFRSIQEIIDKAREREGAEKKKEKNEQFFTPLKVAGFMSGMIKKSNKRKIQILDPGAGIGILTATIIKEICSWSHKPKEVHVDLYEIDETLISYLEETLEICQMICEINNIIFYSRIFRSDFIECITRKMMCNNIETYDYIVMNPPYRKLQTKSQHDLILKSIGIDVPNYYAGFVALSTKVLKNKIGQLVTIIPRSFCNGVYFYKFRLNLLSDVKIERVHIFDSRKKIFKDYDVLQELVIISVTKQCPKHIDTVEITESVELELENLKVQKRKFKEIVFESDRELIIRLGKKADGKIVEKIENLPCTLKELGLDVSTGPIVDFRENEGVLTNEPTHNTVPIIFIEHFYNGSIKWPGTNIKKPNYIIKSENNIKRLRRKGNYLLIKRMTSKEAQKRIVAAVLKEEVIKGEYVGFDNKINYFHIDKQGIHIDIVRGLCLFLNSSIIDRYVRTFSGTTQINVRDLKRIKYPNIEMLISLSNCYDDNLPEQLKIDEIIEKKLFT